jgi:hypothetical protein
MKAMLSFVGVVALSLVAAGAQAQATRTWVSGVGDDANPCSRTAPCKTFAGAISKTATAGEINTLDPGGFGAVTITKSITIASDAFTGGVLASGTNGIVVNAGATGVVILKGLDIDGVGTGLNGISILSCAAVYVEDTRIHNFTQRGINFVPSGNCTLYVRNTVIRDNTNNPNGGGILAQGSASAAANVFLDNVALLRNFFGIRAFDFTKTEIRNSSAIANVNNGFWAFASANNPISMNIASSMSSLNGVSGVRSEGTQTRVRINDVTITDNVTAGLVAGSGGAILSWGNNKNDGNGANGTPTGVIAQQ